MSKMVEKSPKHEEESSDESGNEGGGDEGKELDANFLLSRLNHPLLMKRMLESLPKPVKNRVNALKNLQMDYLNIEAKFFNEVYELEKKYQKLYDPILEKRAQIVNGDYEPNETECEFKDEEEEDVEMAKRLEQFILDSGEIKEKIPEDAKGIPEFWFNVFKNCVLIYEMVQDHDIPLLKKLKDIRLVYPADGMSYTVNFHFDENEFFTNKVLTKQYFLKSELKESKPFDYEGTEIFKCSGCKINWNKGKDLTVKTIRKKQKHKSRGAVRTITKQVPNDTFFNFFDPPTMPENEEDIDPNKEMILESDFNIGHYIRTRIIPRAVLIYAGIINDDDDDEEEEEEDEFEEEEDDDDDDEEDESPKKKNEPHGKRAHPSKQQNPPECKQQ